MTTLRNYFYIALGWCFFGLGIVGVVLPLVPTTPFMLLAAVCFSKGSPRLYGWLLAQKGIGPVIYDWDRYGVIRPRAKRVATLMMLLLISIPLFLMSVPFYARFLMVVTVVCVLSYIWSRPGSTEEAQKRSVSRDGLSRFR